MPPPTKDKLPKDIGGLSREQLQKLEQLMSTSAASSPDYLTKVLVQSTLKAIADKLASPEKKVANMMARAVKRDFMVYINALELPNKAIVEIVFSQYLADLTQRGGGGGGDSGDEQILQGP
ncbi:MAG: hypothetical protein U0R19_08645 [Bryobacteraceae bacterium]